MNRIAEFYESNHLTVLLIVVIVFVLYILSIKNRNIVTMNIENEDIKDKIQIFDRKIETYSIVKLKYILTGEVVTCDFAKNKYNKYKKPSRNIKRIYFDNPLAVALFDKETGDIIRYRENEIDEKDIYVEVLSVNNNFFTDEEIESFTKDNSEIMNSLENLNDKEKSTNNSEAMEPKIFEYNSTRLSFRKATIDAMNYNDILIINVIGAKNPDSNGRFKMTKTEIHQTFDNVINTVAYNRDGNYNYLSTPNRAQQFRVITMPIILGTICNSKDDLIKLLKNWLETNENTIGDFDNYLGNTKWIFLNLNGNNYYINADTKREGVLDFVKNHEKNYPWKVIPNNRNVYKKVSNNIDGKAIKGLYFYSENIGQRGGVNHLNI